MPRGGAACRRIRQETMSTSAIQKLQSIVEEAWEGRASLSPGSAPVKIRKSVELVLDELDQGRLRVAEKLDGAWHTHQWIKKGVLLSFRLEDSRQIRAGSLRFYDKVSTEGDSESCLPPLRAAGPTSRKTSCSCLPTSMSAPTWTKARWSTPGPRW